MFHNLVDVFTRVYLLDRLRLSRRDVQFDQILIQRNVGVEIIPP